MLARVGGSGPTPGPFTEPMLKELSCLLQSSLRTQGFFLLKSHVRSLFFLFCSFYGNDNSHLYNTLTTTKGLNKYYFRIFISNSPHPCEVSFIIFV